MKNAFIEAFSMKFKECSIIGSDIPDLPLRIYREAFTISDEKDAVIGPSVDGGYYLIGFKDKTFLVPGIWENSLEYGESLWWNDEGLEIKSSHSYVAALRDIETIEDLEIRGPSPTLRFPAEERDSLLLTLSSYPRKRVSSVLLKFQWILDSVSTGMTKKSRVVLDYLACFG